jgi:hypothetical protein
MSTGSLVGFHRGTPQRESYLLAEIALSSH